MTLPQPQLRPGFISLTASFYKPHQGGPERMSEFLTRSQLYPGHYICFTFHWDELLELRGIQSRPVGHHE